MRLRSPTMVVRYLKQCDRAQYLSGVLSGESHFFTQHGLNASLPLTQLETG
ncbi:hypothetical protein [Nostoc sp.]|uniref:hypothetical protein n=1 Tax=Nostoc sp. TaxID=1180 RepID=UPI002FF69781